MMDAMTAAMLALAMFFFIVISFTNWKTPLKVLAIVLGVYALLIGFYVMFRLTGMD